jgi:hypothetical protein
MRTPRLQSDWQRAISSVAESELQVRKQKRLIKKLQRQGLPTAAAKEKLASFEWRLLQLRNYLEILQELKRNNN